MRIRPNTFIFHYINKYVLLRNHYGERIKHEYKVLLTSKRTVLNNKDLHLHHNNHVNILWSLY